MRLLLAIPGLPAAELIQSVLDSARCFTPFDVTYAEAHTKEEVEERISLKLDDVVILDWDLAGANTPGLVRTLLEQNGQLRVVVLLPANLRQYRQLVWEAGACNGIPKEYMDQEWLSTVLCIMYRAMEREKRLILAYASGDIDG